MSDPDRAARIATSFERIAAWMNANGAEVLVQNLAKGSTPARLAAFESQLGAPMPADLRAMWSVHAGQIGEQDGFVGAMDLLGPEAAVGERENVSLFLGFVRDDRPSWDEAGVTAAEVASDAWVAFAGRGYADLLVVSAVSGRVFTCGKQTYPPLHLVAPSILAWIEAYADRVEAGVYRVEEGFGECYLAREDEML